MIARVTGPAMINCAPGLCPRLSQPRCDIDFGSAVAALRRLAQPPDLLERFNVRGVLEPTGALRFNEVVETDQRDSHSVHIYRARVRRRLLVLHLPRDAEDIDPMVFA